MAGEKKQVAPTKRFVFTNTKNEVEALKFKARALTFLNQGNIYDALRSANEALVINPLSFNDSPVSIPTAYKIIIINACDKASLENLDIKYEQPDQEPLFLMVTESQNEKIIRRLDNEFNNRKSINTTILNYAARHGFLAVVKNLINSHAEVDELDDYGMSSLMWARKYGHRLVVKYLVEEVTSPEILLRKKVHILISTGEFEKASLIIDDVIKHNGAVFGRMRNALINKKASLGQMFEVPVPVLPLEGKLTQLEIRNWAEYYKKEAIEKFSQHKIFSACRLMEEALSYDGELTFPEFNLNFVKDFKVYHCKIYKLKEKRIDALLNLVADSIIVRTHPRLEIFILDPNGFNYAVQGKYEMDSFLDYPNFSSGLVPLCIILASLGYRRSLHTFLRKTTPEAHYTDIVMHEISCCSARFGQIEILSYLVKERGVNLNVFDKTDGKSNYSGMETPLEIVCRQNDIETAKILISLGAEVKFDSSDLLTLVIQNRSFAFLKLLCLHGAKATFENIVFTVEHGQIEMAKILVDNGLSETVLKNQQISGDEKDECYLSEMIRLLLNPDAMVCSLDSNKGLPLCKASRYGHVESVQFLLDRGAPVNAESSVDPNALTLASLKNYSEVVKVLLDHGASVSARGSRGRTALSLAAENGCVEAGKLLLDYGADVDSAEHDDRERGFTPLMYAAHKGHYKMVELLIKHHASINKKDLNGQTAIMYAQKAGASWIVGSLLNNQVDLQNVDSHGVTLLMMACAIKDLRNVRRLVDEKHVSLDTVDHHGRTAFHYACLAGTNEIIEYLLGKGVDINHTDHLGRSGLMLVLEDENCDGSIVNILWNKSDPKSTDKYGRTALMYAISWSNLNIINNMLHMADIHIKDLEGNTALDQCLHQYSNNSLFVGIQNNKIAKVSSHFSFDQVFAEAFGETAKSAHKLLRDRVNEVKQFLRPAIEEFLKKEAFINYLAQRECVGSDVILEDISKNLERYSTDHSIIMAFVDFDLRDKVSDGGWAHLMTLQALARLKVMTLYCWEEIEGDLILRQRVNNDMPPGNSTRRDILLRRGYRFDLINFGRFKDDIPSTPDSPERILSEVFGSNRRWAHEHLTNRIGSFRWFLKRAIKEFLKKEVFFNYLVQREFLGSEITLEDISKNLEHYSSDHSILMAFIDYDLRDKVTDGGWPHLITLQVLAWTHKITLDCYEEKGGDLVMCQNDIRSEKTRIRHILRRRGYHFDQIKFEVIKDDIPPTADMPEYPLKRVHVAKKFSCDVIKRLVESGCTITLEKRAEFKKESLLALDSIQESIQQSIQQERERLNANINIWSRFFSGQNPYANTPPNNTLVLKK